jgi:NDP-sugar pyrophosphorylase family protein
MAAESKHMRALDGALIDSAATIAPSARITSGSAVGASRIEESVVIHESMIGDGVLVAKGSQISHSIIGDGVSVGAGAELVGVVIAGPEVVIAANSRHLGELQ